MSRGETGQWPWTSETYKMDHNLLWRLVVKTTHSTLCHLPLDNTLGMCMAHQVAGHAPDADTLIQSTHHGSYPRADSFGLAHRHTPSAAGNCVCPPSVQNPPKDQSHEHNLGISEWLHAMQFSCAISCVKCGVSIQCSEQHVCLHPQGPDDGNSLWTLDMNSILRGQLPERASTVQ